MRERVMAIGCGGVTLFLALVSVAMSVLDAWQADRPPYVGWAIAAFTGLFALAASSVAVRRKQDDDDPFEGERGLALARRSTRRRCRRRSTSSPSASRWTSPRTTTRRTWARA